jgi:hypothetical protein
LNLADSGIFQGSDQTIDARGRNIGDGSGDQRRLPLPGKGDAGVFAEYLAGFLNGGAKHERGQIKAVQCGGLIEHNPQAVIEALA